MLFANHKTEMEFKSKFHIQTKLFNCNEKKKKEEKNIKQTKYNTNERRIIKLKLGLVFSFKRYVLWVFGNKIKLQRK